jgi:hypothetical protein
MSPNSADSAAESDSSTGSNGAASTPRRYAKKILQEKQQGPFYSQMQDGNCSAEEKDGKSG